MAHIHGRQPDRRERLVRQAGERRRPLLDRIPDELLAELDDGTVLKRLDEYDALLAKADGLVYTEREISWELRRQAADLLAAEPLAALQAEHARLLAKAADVGNADPALREGYRSRAAEILVKLETVQRAAPPSPSVPATLTKIDTAAIVKRALQAHKRMGAGEVAADLVKTLRARAAAIGNADPDLAQGYRDMADELLAKLDG